MVTSVEATSLPRPTPKRRMHPLAVRVMHWTNAASILIMIFSGWKIYNDDIIFHWLHFDEDFTLGGEAQGALQWHFLGMWPLVINGLIYILYGFFSGRFRRMLLPFSLRALLADISDALHFRLGHADLTKYNMVQKLLYGGIMIVVMLQVVTGLALWKPVQFSFLLPLFNGFQGTRLVHFILMVAIVLFVLVHVGLALLVPKTLVAMITGDPPTGKHATSPTSPTSHHGV